MEIKDKDLVMVDFSALDRRSFKAYLNGTGDNRITYYEQMRHKRGDADLEALKVAYREVIIDKMIADEEAEERGMKTAGGVSKTTGVVRHFVTAAVGLFLGALVYQTIAGWVT